MSSSCSICVGADDGGGNGRVRQHPGNRRLSNRRIVRVANFLQLIHRAKPLFIHVAAAHAIGPGRVGHGRVAAVFAGEETGRQRAVRNHANALIQAKRLQFPLKFGPMHQAVMGLQAVKARQILHVADPERFGQQPGGIVGAADVAHHAGAHQIVERGQRFIQRRFLVRPMDLVQVDVISLQPIQTGFHGIQNVLARKTLIVGAVCPSGRALWWPE